jgi:hypothetical protein
MTPSPFRCETCKYHVFQKLMKHPHICDSPELEEYDPTGVLGLNFIGLGEYTRILALGCASHSDINEGVQP